MPAVASIDLNAELDRLYKTLPHIKCKQLCQDCCGPIAMTEAEWRRIVDRVGCVTPVQRMMLKLESRQSIGRAVITDCETCPLLRDGQCSIYDIRPLICRIWGLVKDMRCPHGCTPKFWLSPRQSYELLSQAERLSHQHYP